MAVPGHRVKGAGGKGGVDDAAGTIPAVPSSQNVFPVRPKGMPGMQGGRKVTKFNVARVVRGSAPGDAVV